jgi:putative phosphoesterase
MRYGVFADVHSNLPALQAVLAALERERVDAYLCAGDLVGYGAFPNECVRLVRDLGAATVAGNHDLIAVGALSDARCIPIARRTLAWTRDVLAADARAYLEALPLRARAGDTVIAHGSLDDPEAYVTRPRAATQLEQLAREQPDARTLVLGHTHRPLEVRGERLLVNPGAVGQSREWRVRARFAVLEDGRVELHAVPYDVERARAELRRHGLPTGTPHLRPSPARAAARRVLRR